MIFLDKNDQGMFLQVNTGEGKSFIVAMLAVLLAINGKNPDIITSSSVLAKRDAEDNKIFFTIFGLESSHNCYESID